VRFKATLERDDFSLNRHPALPLVLEHDLFRPAFARRSIKPNADAVPRLRAGGKPVSTPTFAGAGFFGIML
jgi:hypothetical protein